MKLTEEEKKSFALLIEGFPDDGTDWDGIHDEVARQMLSNQEKTRRHDSIMEYVSNHRGLFSHNVLEWIKAQK